MKYSVITLVIITASFLMEGCLVFQKMSYVIDLESNTKGKATVYIYDIMSNPLDSDDFSADQKNLFEYSLKSKEFLSQMASEGRNIKTRDLFLSGDTLNAKVTFTFEELNKVEGITYEDGFFYLTLTPEDSVVSTNGEVINSNKYKRILWDSNAKQLTFEMLGYEKKEPEFKTLSPYLKQYK